MYWTFMEAECMHIWEEEDVSAEYAQKHEEILFSSMWLCVEPDKYHSLAGNAMQTWETNPKSTTFEHMEILLQVNIYILVRRWRKTHVEVSRIRDMFAQRYHVLREDSFHPTASM